MDSIFLSLWQAFLWSSFGSTDLKWNENIFFILCPCLSHLFRTLKFTASHSYHNGRLIYNKNYSALMFKCKMWWIKSELYRDQFIRRWIGALALSLKNWHTYAMPRVIDGCTTSVLHNKFIIFLFHTFSSHLSFYVILCASVRFCLDITKYLLVCDDARANERR